MFFTFKHNIRYVKRMYVAEILGDMFIYVTKW